MTKEERVEQLVKAARLVEGVAAELDRKVSNCECCGAYKYENRAHYNMGVEFDAVVRKLKSFASTIQRGKDHDWRTVNLGK